MRRVLRLRVGHRNRREGCGLARGGECRSLSWHSAASYLMSRKFPDGSFREGRLSSTDSQHIYITMLCSGFVDRLL